MQDQKHFLTIHNLYPELSETQLAEAEENLGRYIELVLRICERMELEIKERNGSRALTDQDRNATIKDTVALQPP